MCLSNQASSSFNTRSTEARFTFLFVLLMCVLLCEGVRRLQVGRAKQLLERQHILASEVAAELLGSVIEREIKARRTKAKKRPAVSCRPIDPPAPVEAQLHCSEELVVESPWEESCASTRTHSIVIDDSDKGVLRSNSDSESVLCAVPDHPIDQSASEETWLHPSEELTVHSPLEDGSSQSEVACSPDCGESCASTHSAVSEESDDEASLGTDSDNLSISEFLELPPGLSPPPGLDLPGSGLLEVPCNQIYSRAALLQRAVFLKTHATEAPSGFRPLMLQEVHGLNEALRCSIPRWRPRAWVARARPDGFA
jgi:hypothetical protein